MSRPAPILRQHPVKWRGRTHVGEFDAVIQQALRDVHGLLVDNIAPARGLSDDRTVSCLNAVLGKENVRQALEKANDTALCFALREVKYVLNQRQKRRPQSISCGASSNSLD